MKYLFALLLLAVSSFGQISGAGQLGCDPNVVTGTVWNSSTALNAVQPIITGAQSSTYAIVVLETTSTMTTGAVEFQVAYDNVPNYSTVQPMGATPNFPTLNLTSLATTLAPSTIAVYSIPIYGVQSAQLLLSTVISGTGTLTPYFIVTCSQQPSQVDAFGNTTTDLSALNGVLLGGPSTFGTSPGAVQVPGVNASIFTGSTVVSSSAPLPVKTPLPATILAGQKAVTATAAALATNTLVNGLCIEALSTNLISVFIGPSGVTTSTGLELAAGATYCPSVSNSNAIYVIASTTGASVSWSGN